MERLYDMTTPETARRVSYPIQVEDVRPATAGEWDSAWESCRWATYFQSRGWAETWSRYEPRLVPSPHLVEFSDGLTAVVSLMQRRHRTGLDALATYLWSPATTYGGWLCTQPLCNEHVALLVETVLARFSPLRWRINAFDPKAKDSFLAHARGRVTFRPSLGRRLRVDIEQDYTRALDLSHDFDDIFRRWTKGHRSAVGKAQREGVTIRCSENLEEWKEYFGIYERALARWGEDATSVYHWELFELLFEQREHVKLWVADYDDRIVAGALLLYGPKHVSYWHGASLREYSRVRAVNLLMYEGIRDAVDRGLRWYDFNPSGGHEGVEAFKKSFAASKFSSPVVSTTKGWRLLLAKGKGIMREALPRWFNRASHHLD